MRGGSVRPWMAFAGCAIFGALWGTWGASIPAMRDQAGVTDGQLGAALLFIGAGALPAMPLSGRVVDRWGLRATAALLTLLGAAGVLVAVAARDLVALAITLTVLGAASGAADVAINTAAGSAQRASDSPVVTRAHATFSATVVVASLLTGALRALDAPVVTPFVVVAAAAVVVATALARGGGAPEQHEARAGASSRRGAAAEGAPDGDAPPRWKRPDVPLVTLLVLGGLGALAFAVENAHQSWSALFLGDELGAGPAVAAAGPAVFAAVVAVTRFASASVADRRPTAVMVTGSALAATGTALLAGASGVPVGLVGLALAAAGTAALFPTLMSALTARVSDERRGTATSVVTSVSYLGFLAGPVYVGTWAGAVGLPGAMLAVAALAAALALVVAPVLRAIAPPAGSPTCGRPPEGAPERRQLSA